MATNSDYDAGGNVDAELRDDAIALRTRTNVGWVATGLNAALGVVLLLTSGSGSEDAASGWRECGACVRF